MEIMERIRPTTVPPPGPLVVPAKSGATEDDGYSAPDDGLENRIQLVETEGRIFQARLSYDPESAEVFVEILDPTTGDVIRRFPAEEAAEKQSAFRQGGQLVDQLT